VPPTTSSIFRVRGRCRSVSRCWPILSVLPGGTGSPLTGRLLALPPLAHCPPRVSWSHTIQVVNSTGDFLALQIHCEPCTLAYVLPINLDAVASTLRLPCC
jgi:hypothetical protein